MASPASASTSNDTLPMRFSRPQEQEDGVASWRDLPSDVYGQILRRLPSCRDRVRLSVVCRQWHVCARHHMPRLPMRVTRTARGTHVVRLRGFSRLQEEQCVGGFVDSPAFAVAGLHWAIRYYPGSDGDDERGHVRAFVMPMTEGAAAREYAGLLLVDQITGLADTVVFKHAMFDAARADSCTWTSGTGGMVGKRSELKGSRFVRGDCLKIECVVHGVCRGIAC